MAGDRSAKVLQGNPRGVNGLDGVQKGRRSLEREDAPRHEICDALARQATPMEPSSKQG